MECLFNISEMLLIAQVPESVLFQRKAFKIRLGVESGGWWGELGKVCSELSLTFH